MCAKGPGVCREENRLGRKRFGREKGELGAPPLEMSLELTVRSEEAASLEGISFPSSSW